MVNDVICLSWVVWYFSALGCVVYVVYCPWVVWCMLSAALGLCGACCLLPLGCVVHVVCCHWVVWCMLSAALG